MGVFGAVFGRRGVVGFNGPVLGGASSGVVGFNVAMFLRAVRDICRPARPDVGASVKELALRAHNGQKLAFDGALGEFFADQQSWDPDGRVCCAACLAAGSFCWRP